MSKVPLISIVDDDALARDGISELVESLGYRAVTFSAAEYFLRSDVIAETTCLITYMQMPGLNGLELQEALQSLGHQTPAVVITRRISRTASVASGMLHNVQVVTTVSILWVSSGIASAEPSINSGRGVSEPRFRRTIESSLAEGSRPMRSFTLRE